MGVGFANLVHIFLYFMPLTGKLCLFATFHSLSMGLLKCFHTPSAALRGNHWHNLLWVNQRNKLASYLLHKWGKALHQKLTCSIDIFLFGWAEVCLNLILYYFIIEQHQPRPRWNHLALSCRPDMAKIQLHTEENEL